MTSNIAWCIAGVIGITVMTGCMSNPAETEKDYGYSATNLMNAQRFDPQAPRQPDKVPNGDAVKAVNSLEQYRGDVAQAAKKQENISKQHMLPLTAP